MTLPFQENFTGDNDPLSGRTGWSATLLNNVNDTAKSSGGAYVDNSGNGDDKGAYADADTYADDQYAQVVVENAGTTANNRVGLLLRTGGTNNGFLVRYQTNDNTFHAYYWSGGTRTEFGTSYTATALTTSDKIRVEISGSATKTLYLFIDTGSGFGTSVKTWTTTSGPTSGSPGVYLVDSTDGWRLDDWEGGNLSTAATAAITGTATSGTVESDIVSGTSGTVIITLTGDTFIAAGTGPIGTSAQSLALLQSLDSAQSEAAGWDAEVKANFVSSDLVRTSDTVATITIGAEAAYAITANETITVGDIANAILTTSATDITPTSNTFVITNETPALSFDFSGSTNVFKNNTGTALASRTGIIADIYLQSTGAAVGARKTGLTTDVSGNLDDISDASYTSAEHNIIVEFAEGEQALVRGKTPA